MEKIADFPPGSFQDKTPEEQLKLAQEYVQYLQQYPEEAEAIISDDRSALESAKQSVAELEEYQSWFEQHPDDSAGNLNSQTANGDQAPWLKNDKLRVIMVNQQADAEALARESAHRRLEKEIADDLDNGIGRIQYLLKNKIWKSSLGREYILYKYQQQAMVEIKNNKSILANHDLTPEERQKANETTILRFIEEGDDKIHSLAGEQKRLIDASTEAGRAMKQLVYDLLDQKIKQPDLEPGSFDEVVKLQMQDHARQFGDEALVARGEFYINNLAAIADAARERAEHMANVESIDRNEAVRRVLSEVEIYTGESRNMARTEARLTKTEKLVQRLNNEAGAARLLIKPEVIAGAVALSSGVVNHLAKTGGRRAVSMAVPLLGGAVASGLIGGLEEAYYQQEAREFQQRQLAQGGRVENLTDLERQKLESFAYNVDTATNILADFQECFATIPDLQGDLSHNEQQKLIEDWLRHKRQELSGNQDEFNAMIAELIKDNMEHVAYANSRINISDKQRLDLIRYSGLEAVERERWEIDINRAKMNTYLKKILNFSPEIAQTLFANHGVQTSSDVSDDYGRLLGNLEEAWSESIENDIDIKDKAFRNFKRKRVFEKILQKTATGLVAGVAVQEGLALVNDSLHGVLENVIGQANYSTDTPVQDTLLARVLNRGVEVSKSKIDFRDQHLENIFNNNIGTVQINGGFSLVADHATKGIDLLDATGKIVLDDLQVENGNFTTQSLRLLQDAGFRIDSSSVTVVDQVKEVARQLSPAEFLQKNSDNLASTTVGYWYDNDTTIIDGNELRLDLGLGANQEIILSINRMIDGQSFHQGAVADVAKEKLFVSAGRASQKLNFVFEPDANGNVVITPDSEVYKLFSVDGNKVEFNGGFIQAANIVGSNQQEMVIAPLATIVGEDNFQGVTDVAKVETFKQVFSHTLIAPESKVVAESVMALPPFVPLYTRRELPPITYDKLKNGDGAIGSPGYYESLRNKYSVGSGAEVTGETEGFYPAKQRQALGDNLGQVMKWYDHHIEQQNGRTYTEWINKKVTESGLGGINPATKVVLQIPIYAAGESEAANIGNILQRGYARQINDNHQQHNVALFLNVNWRHQDEADPQKLANIQNVVRQVQAFKKNNPRVQVYPIYNTFTDVQIKASGNVINQITKQNIDIILSALGQSVRDGRVGADFNPLLVRNDADAEAIDKNYFANLISSAEKYQDVEIFSGVTYFDRRIAQRNPVLSLSLELLQAMNIYGKARGNIHTAGANFACRAKSIAETGFGFNAKMFGIGSDDLQFGQLIQQKRLQAETDGAQFKNNLGRLVGGARIMTNGDRQEQAYLAGKNGIDPWSNEGSFYDDYGNYLGRNLGKNSIQVSDMELPRAMSEVAAKQELKARLEANLSLVLKYNPEENYYYAKTWLNRYLNIASVNDGEYYEISGKQIRFTSQGIERAYEMLITNNQQFTDFLQAKTDYWNVL